jgi:DNA-binding CsgD family transcriptional regulator
VSASLDERERALALIGHIYDAALEPSRWSDVVRGIVEFIGGAKGLLLVSRTRFAQSHFVFPYRLSAAVLQRWQDEYADGHAWSAGARNKGLDVDGSVALGTDLVSDEQLQQSAAYQDLAKREGIGQLCTGVVFGRKASDMPPTQCSVFRALDDAKFSDRERERMRVLIPHLSRALGVMFRLRSAECKAAASLAALERLGTGVLLLEERGHAIFANRFAQRTLDERDGLTLRSAQVSGGVCRIVANDVATQSRIDDAIRECLDERAWVVAHFSRGVAVRRAANRRDLALQFAPLPRDNEYETDGRHARVIVFLTDPDESSCVTAPTLARLYKLTGAEGRLALALGRGDTLTEAAKRSGITIATARTQLAAVFQKTGTTRQAELMRLLVTLGSNRGDSN